MTTGKLITWGFLHWLFLARLDRIWLSRLLPVRSRIPACCKAMRHFPLARLPCFKDGQ